MDAVERVGSLAGRERAAADLGKDEGRARNPKGDRWHDGNAWSIREAGAIGRTTLIEAADDHACRLLPLLRPLRGEGAITIGAITRLFNERKIPTPRGARWHVSSVANLLARAQHLERPAVILERSALLTMIRKVA